MKVVILCGGRGTRINEETTVRPKALVEIGDKPILWHIMKFYSHYGFNDFIICLGYKGRMIKEYFLNYELMKNDFSMNLGTNDIALHGKSKEEDWKITFAETGLDAQTGTRVKKIEKYIDEDAFMLTYGDGLTNADIGSILKFHKSHGKIGTITGVHPLSRFGELVIEKHQIVEFSKRSQIDKGYIDGGYMIFNKEFFDYLWDDNTCHLELEPLEKLAEDGESMVYLHNGFWQCMDTYRELEILNSLWKSPEPPWKIWK